MLLPLSEIFPTSLDAQFKRDFEVQLAAYTDNYLRDYNNITIQLESLLLKEAEGNGALKNDSKRQILRRRRRQFVAPNIGSLQSGYGNFFGNKNRRNYEKPKNRKAMKDKKPPDDDMPIVLVPQEDETECVASNRLSSFGFLGFVLNVVNAVINVSNNINNNDNSNNDNNNNNNNNDQNVNMVQITQTSDNTNMAMAMAGRRLDRLKMMRSELRTNVRRVSSYKKRRRRGRGSSFTSDSSCDGDYDVVDEALLASVALIDMWKEVAFEVDPRCMALEICETSRKLNQFSRLAGMMADVASVAVANILKNFQEVNPEYLVFASEQGRLGVNCGQLFRNCRHTNSIKI